MDQNTTIHISRRSFIRRVSASAVATGLPLWFIERELAMAAEPLKTTASPNERPSIALIGCGGMGSADATNAKRLADIVAVCDVDQQHLSKAVEAFNVDGKKPAAFTDFRKLLERGDIHAVINGTPDHWHTLINIGAARAGKDIYSEKPLTLTIDEGHQVVKAVRENKTVLQTGTQQRSSQRFRMACELVRNKRIGDLKEVHVWLPAGLHGGPFSPQPVPTHLDWDYWQGQAPASGYLPERCHTKFRNWYDYSGGTMTDWGEHHMDIGFWAVGTQAAETVEGTILIPPVPGGFSTISEYEVKFQFSNGVLFHVHTTNAENPFGGLIKPGGQRNGIRFEGTNGWIWVNRETIQATEREMLSTPLPDDALRLPFSNDHMANFIECMGTRKDPICDVETGHRSATVCHLGAIALRTGKKLTWDGASERFTGPDADAGNAHLVREMRKPYDYGFVA
jgi:predicted dehydrogenase